MEWANEFHNCHVLQGVRFQVSSLSFWGSSFPISYIIAWQALRFHEALQIPKQSKRKTHPFKKHQLCYFLMPPNFKQTLFTKKNMEAEFGNLRVPLNATLSGNKAMLKGS